MNVIDTLTKRNEVFSKTRFSKEWKILPSLKTMIVGCVDPPRRPHGDLRPGT